MNNYVYIQRIRFGSKFTFQTDIDESCLDCHIIKLVFQPFIENSIKHGSMESLPAEASFSA